MTIHGNSQFSTLLIMTVFTISSFTINVSVLQFSANLQDQPKPKINFHSQQPELNINNNIEESLYRTRLPNAKRRQSPLLH